MSKNQFDAKLAKVKRRNEGIEYRRRLWEERTKYWPKFIKPTTSKLMLGVSAVLSFEVIIFCQYMIITTGDMSALYAMVGAAFTFLGTVLGYYAKATRQNSSGGITYESAMADRANQIHGNATSSSDVAVG